MNLNIMLEDVVSDLLCLESCLNIVFLRRFINMCHCVLASSVSSLSSAGLYGGATSVSDGILFCVLGAWIWFSCHLIAVFLFCDPGSWFSNFPSLPSRCCSCPCCRLDQVATSLYSSAISIYRYAIFLCSLDDSLVGQLTMDKWSHLEEKVSFTGNLKPKSSFLKSIALLSRLVLLILTIEFVS